MWDLRIAHPFSKFSGRKILTCVAVLLVTCFLYIFVAAPTAHAADAQWSGDSITYGGQQYTKIDRSNSAYSTTLPGAVQYLYLETPLSSAGTGLHTAHVIYFADGVDPPKATTANYITYNYVAPSTYNQATAAKAISLTVQPPAETTNPGTSSCKMDRDTPGLSWVICPVTNTLANAMDSLYGILSSFLTVRPVQTNQENALYRAWSIMRNFANVAFVIGFLIIIYSQISNIGLTNYGIKKMLPRLIIAAILVNISYWICAIAIDISNIAGYSIQDIFIGIRNSIVGTEGNGWVEGSGVVGSISWKSIAAIVLSGGIAGGIGIAALLVNPGSIFMLLPILLGVITAALIALLVLAARQAIITILVIVAPLAFVAYLLPNTEKYFEKWRELFTTMLVMFPIFSIIFGGSQLAGTAIIQNADSIITVILGMGVQVAPVVITPLIVRFSGSLLGKIAGMVNNPNKGLIDRTRKWAGERGDQYTSKVMGNRDNKYNDVFSRTGRRIRQGQRFREELKKSNDAAADNIFHGSEGKKGYGRIDEINRGLEQDKQIIEHKHDKHWNDTVSVNAKLLEKELQVRLTGDQAEQAKKHLDTIYTEAQYGARPAAFNSLGRNISPSMVDIINNTQDTALEITREALRKQNADRALSSMQHKDIKESDADQQVRIGGVRGELGANSAVAYAISEERKAFGQGSAESSELWRHFNPDSKELQKFIKGEAITLEDDTGTSRTFKADDMYARDAAIEMQITEGPVKYAIEIGSMSGGELYDYRTTVASAWAKAGLSRKTSFAGGTVLDQIKSGYFTSPDKFTKGAAQDAIAKGKIAPDVLADIDVDAVQTYVEAALAAHDGNTMHMDAELRGHIEAQVQGFSNHAWRALNDPLYKGRIKDNVRHQLQTLLDTVPENVTPEEKARFS